MLLAVIVNVSISILKKVRWMVGPSTFDGLTGAFILWHNESMAEGLFEHSLEAGVPVVQRLSR